MEYVVTTVRNNQSNFLSQAREWARDLGKTFVYRGNCNLEDLLTEFSVQAVLVASGQGPKIYSKDGILFYHPSLAKLRIAKLVQGGTDHLVEAMNLQSGMKVLDCTLGLGADALVASYVVGERGRVIGLEGSELIYFAVQYGLQNYSCRNEIMERAMRRIQCQHGDAESFLEKTSENFDVVYFDPMFETPVSASSNMEPLRTLAYARPLTVQLVKKALEHAPRVVIKERYEQFLLNLGCREFYGGKYSSVKYGVVKK